MTMNTDNKMNLNTEYNGRGETADIKPPLISVVIACFNQARELELTLRSFFNQSFPYRDYEIIVVDDHSPDLAARETTARLRDDYPEAILDYIRHYRADGGHYGYSARVKNIGLRCARGKYVFFNNSEIVQAGESLSYIARRMESSSAPLCLRGRVLDLPYEDLAGLGPGALEALHDVTDRRRERVATADHAGLAAVSRPLLIRVGGNDERFDYWGKEDLDLAARLKRAGAQYIYDDQLKSFHIHHPPNHVKQGHYLRMCSLLEENNRRGLVEANAGHCWGSLAPAPPQALSGTVLLEYDGDSQKLDAHLKKLLLNPPDRESQMEVRVMCREKVRPLAESLLNACYRTVPLLALPDDGEEMIGSWLLNKARTEKLAFIPAGLEPAVPDWKLLDETPGGVFPWVGAPEFPPETARLLKEKNAGWLCGAETARNCLAETRSLEEWKSDLIYRSCTPVPRPVAGRRRPVITGESRVMAIIPHYRCEEYLQQCLESLFQQTRPPDAVVVADDASPEPPEAIVRRFPGATLISMQENSGPYRIIQQVIDSSAFDAYLFQDADDWSAPDRLQRLLAEAEKTGAELVGSQELRVFCGEGPVNIIRPVCYPLDVNRALSVKPGHPLLHPTSMVSRALARRIGGFACGLRFGGDTEFLLRAAFVARIVNIPGFCYYRRSRPGSLTTAPATGLGSPPREMLLKALKERALENMARRNDGLEPILEPLKTCSPAVWRHVCGPAFPGEMTGNKD